VGYRPAMRALPGPRQHSSRIFKKPAEKLPRFAAHIETIELALGSQELGSLTSDDQITVEVPDTLCR
jgi:hypothetical protein